MTGVLIVLDVVIYLAVRGTRPAKPPQARRNPPPRRMQGPPARRPGNQIAGWMLGHQIARGYHGFPGDPLPGGHLDSPADLADWGGALGDEEGDVDED